MRFQKPKGTTDFYPQDQALRQTIQSSFLRVARRHNYNEVESPAFEEITLLSEKEGEDIKQEIFVLEKRGDETFGLRFDLTVPLTRMFLQTQKESPKPVKWCYGARAWRYERPQKGRLREFYQMGVELFGSASAQADAEVICLTVEVLQELGLRATDFRVHISNRKLIQGLLQDCVKESNLDELCRLIDKRDRLEPNEFRRDLQKLADPDHVLRIIDLTDMDAIGKLKMNALARQGFDELKTIYDLLDPHVVVISLSMVRGFTYYTGLIFEVFDIEKKYRAVAGGGRYDNLVAQFGGEQTPATGMAIGYSTLCLLLEDAKLLPKIDLGPDYYIAPVDESVKRQAWELCESLRHKHSVDIDLLGRSLGKQLSYAGSIGAKKVIVVGPKDLKAGVVTVRDMNSGAESQVRVSDLLYSKLSYSRFTK